MSEESQKLDILLNFRSQGYNLLDTDDPGIMKLSLGGGYTLLADINHAWEIEFNDGIETSMYPVESPRVPYTNAKDAVLLWGKYQAACKEAVIDCSPKKKVVKEPKKMSLEERLAALDRIMDGETA